jgi:hypothetical protein
MGSAESYRAPPSCGRAVDRGWVVPLCRTCHALVSERQRDLPPEVRRPRTRRDRHRALLRAVADTLRVLGEGARSTRAVVERLTEEIEREDAL